MTPRGCATLRHLAVASLVLAATVAGHGRAIAQDQPGAAAVQAGKPSGAAETLEAIHDDFNQQVLGLERARLGRIARLAESQPPTEAEVTYEYLFRLAIASDLFADAEATATKLIKTGSPSPTTGALARLVKIIAEADRGAFEESLEDLRQAFESVEKAQAAGASRGTLQPDEVTGIADAYYQRLVHNGQFSIARQAFQLALKHARNPEVQAFLTARLKRLEMVGKPAPSIEGHDIDGKPFRLADQKGKLVLVEFWATWCLPSETEIDWFQQAAIRYKEKGLAVVGINLDTLAEGGQKLDAVLPAIRQYLIAHNMRWPNLVNGTGAQDFAAAYGVTDIPASVLIGRDGTIVQIDLVRKNLEEVLAREINR